MQVSVTAAEGLQRSMTVEIPADKIQEEINQRLKKMASQVRMDGFRPGKVPFGVVQKRYGGEVRNEVESEIVRTSFYEAVQQEKLRPAGTPKIETSDSDGEKLAFTATFEVYPDVKVEIPADLTVEKPVVEVSDGDVDGMLDKLRQQRATWETVERAAENGDQVVIDFLGKVDDVAFDGGAASDFVLELGSSRFIKGFEEKLIGVSAGDERAVEVSFPEDYQSKDLAGKPAVFDVTIKEVKGSKLPELDDAEFLTALGSSDGGIDGLRSEIRGSMERELKQRIDSKIKENLLDKLLAANPIEVPAVLIDEEIAQIATQSRQNMGIPDDAPVSDEMRASMEPQARRRVTLGLMVGELIREKGFTSDEQKVKARIESLATTYEDPQSVVRWYFEDKTRLAGVEALVLEDQVVDWLLGEVKSEDVQKTFDDLMQAN